VISVEHGELDPQDEQVEAFGLLVVITHIAGDLS